jgi:Tfp pilus assembly PilM family ATPase
MHILAIDIGSYSVKYISSFVEKRKVNHVEMSEIIINDFIVDHPGISETEAQVSIVKDIIETSGKPDSRIIFQFDNELLSTRFLTLPVKSKKKAELMLPFQLEEDIPYGLSEIHFGHRMEFAKTQYMALVGLVKENQFETNYNLFKDKNALPNILTTEASVVENYFNQNAIAGPFCVLDIGHKTSKAYIFYNSRLIATHVSYMGGSHINEMISKTYSLDIEEAIMYKHQSAFLLTSNLLDSVDSSQKEFALAMDKAFAPLVTDFLRWKIGLKVNFGLSLQHVFITGGSANIRNITGYLSEKWDSKVVLLETFDKVESEKIDINPKNKSKYALTNMMAIGMKRKNRFINLLNGKFAQASSVEIPLHSFAFLGVRVAAVAAVLIISLFVERIFIEKDIKFVNTKLSSLVKNDILAINGRLRRTMATNPKPVLDALVKKQRTIKQEISTIQAAVEIQALHPLVIISQSAAASSATMTEFKSEETGEVSATFIAESAEELEKLKNLIERSALVDSNVEIDAKNLKLKISAMDQ